MKSFYEIPVLTKDPAFGLLIEDQIPRYVDMDGYDGLRGMAEVLARSMPAREIAELSKLANNLDAGGIRVLRVNPSVGDSSVMEQGQFDCLSEAGLTLFAIANDDAGLTEQGLIKKFVCLLALYTGEAFGNWATLVAYLAATRYCELDDRTPPMMNPPSEYLKVDPNWWGLPVPANTTQVMEFAGLVVEHCLTWRLTRGVINSVSYWLSEKGGEHESFEQLLAAFRAEAPLKDWVR